MSHLRTAAVGNNVNYKYKKDLQDIQHKKKETIILQLKWIGSLKNNKARDPTGYVNEIFKEEIIGTDLKRSLLSMMNKIKKEKIIPEFMRITNLTTVPKKGPLTELENERGIFRVDIIRSILIKLIYNEKYSEIDENMSDSQMGGRKGKGCRFNLFIINDIIHDV